MVNLVCLMKHEMWKYGKPWHHAAFCLLLTAQMNDCHDNLVMLDREGGPFEDLMEADQAPDSPKDSLTSLVSLLAVVYKAFPDLFLDPALR